jgi:CHAT domain-containing protein/tetratricopeptide (TPR) repeat protein
LAFYREAASIHERTGNRDDEGGTLSNIGLVFRSIGQPDSAILYYRRSLSIGREVGARWQAVVLNNIGQVFYDIGQLDSALTYYRQTLAFVREVGWRLGEGKSLNNLGSLYAELGRADSALACYQRAKEILAEVSDQQGVSLALHNIGDLYGATHYPDSALIYFRLALAIQRESRDLPSQGRTLAAIGQVFETENQVDSALALFQEGLGMLRAAGDRTGEGTTLEKIASHYRAIGNLRNTVAYYDSAAAMRAAVFAHVASDPGRLSFAEQRANLFDAWTLAWLARVDGQGSVTAALAAAERGRAQALLHLMRGTHRPVPPGADLVAEGRQLLADTRGTGTAVLYYLVTEDTLVIWTAPPSGDVASARVAVNHDTLGQLVATWRAGLGADEAAVRGRLLASRGGLPLEQDAAFERGPSRQRAATTAAKTLGALLLPRKLTRYLEGSRELVIVQQGPLALMPFAALPMDSTGALLGERFAIRYTPSLASLAEAERRSRRDLTRSHRRQSLVVGNPDMPTVTTASGTNVTLDPLPGSATEGHWVASYLGSPFLTGAAATQVAVEARLPDAPLVHLATHGFAYSSESMVRQSWVALAPGGGRTGLLTVGDVLDNPSLSLSAELVVLSACQTGLGDLKKAEGTVGLQRAFLARGARSVLVSLWNVSDSATTVMMRAFYTHWLGDRDHPTKAEALRRAEGDVRAQPGFEAPIYWAGFQLVGAE